MIRKLIPLAAILAALAFALPAQAATAISPACGATAFCGGEQLKAPDLALAVRGGTLLSGTPLIAATGSVDPAQDFIIRNQFPPQGGKSFRFAPGGVASGLCVSEPDTRVRTAIVLRRCHPDNPWQAWYPQDVQDPPFVVWVNGASGLALADPNSGGNGTPLVSRHPGFGTAGNELWQPENGVG